MPFREQDREQKPVKTVTTVTSGDRFTTLAYVKVLLSGENVNAAKAKIASYNRSRPKGIEPISLDDVYKNDPMDFLKVKNRVPPDPKRQTFRNV